MSKLRSDNKLSKQFQNLRLSAMELQMQTDDLLQIVNALEAEIKKRRTKK